MEGADSLCMLCVTSFQIQPKKGGGDRGSLLTKRRLQRFCKELECFTTDKSLVGVGVDREERNRIPPRGDDLNLKYESLTVCPTCLNLISTAITEKMSADDLETRVRKLQVQLLRKLEELEGFMSKFYTKMKSIEDVVKNSDGACLSRHYINENRDKRQKSDMVLFRQRILYAVNDLRIYRQELGNKMDCETLVERSKRRKAGEKMEQLINRSTHTEESMAMVIDEPHIKKEKVCEIPTTRGEGLYRPVKNRVESEAQQGSNTPEPGPNSDVECAGDADDHDPDYEYASEGDNGSDFDDNTDSEKSTTPRRSAARKSYARVDEDEDADIHDDIISDAGSNYSDGPELREREKRSTKRQRLKVHLSRLDKLGVPEMPEFKKKVLKRVVEMFQMERRKPAPTSLGNVGDPRKKYPIEYNADKDALLLNDIEIIIDENEKTLRCSKCGFVCQKHPNPRKLSVVSKIHDHILGIHLDAYKCEECYDVRRSFKRYVAHASSHKEVVICSICGKRLKSKDSVYSHMWTHKNDDEKADAIQQGMKDPRNSQLKQKNKPKCHQCSVCGKGFRYLPELASHEKIHTERDRVPCMHCGKELLPNGGLEYHEKYACPLLQSEVRRYQCTVCSKSLKTRMLLRVHMRNMHQQTDQKFICQECGKELKNKPTLQNHMKMHSSLKPYACSKCGTAFKARWTCKCHEKRCNGSGSRKSSTPTKHGVKMETNESGSDLEEHFADRESKLQQVTVVTQQQNLIPNQIALFGNLSHTRQW